MTTDTKPTLLAEIRDSAVESNTDLGELLRRCKVLAARLNSKPLEDWLHLESNGYPYGAELPKYRVWALVVKGEFVGPMGRQMHNAFVPATRIPEEIREDFTRFRCLTSVPGIEEMLRKETRDSFRTDTGDLAIIIGTNLYEGFNCLETFGVFHRNSLVEVLNSVRNRVLDFVLAISKEYPDLEDSSTQIQPERVQQIINMTVLGNVTGVVGIVHGPVTNLDVRAGDLDTLEKYMKAQGLSGSDTKELRAALKEEPIIEDTLGPRVSRWVGRMVTKAASGAWKVGLDVASTIITKAILAYYGKEP